MSDPTSPPLLDAPHVVPDRGLVPVLRMAWSWSRGPARGARIMRRLLISGAALTALVCAGHALVTVSQARRLEAVIAGMRAQGMPTNISQLLPVDLADADNAAVPFRRATALMTVERLDQRALFLRPELEANIGLHSDPDTWSPAARATMRSFLATGDGRALLEQLEAVAAAPQCRFPVRYEDGPAVLLPHLNHARYAGGVLAGAAMLAMEDGSSSDAARHIATAFALATHLRSEPLLISAMTAISVEHMAMRMAHRLLARGADGGSLAALRSIVLSLDDGARIIVTALDAERLIMGDSVFSGRLVVDEYKQRGKGMAWLARALWVSDVGAPLRLYDQRCYLERMRDARQRASVEPFQAWGPPPPSTGLALVTRMVLPSFESRPTAFATRWQRVLAMRLAVALAEHRLAHGEYPSELSSLAPRFLPAVPRQPVNGEPYGYEVAADGSCELTGVALSQRPTPDPLLRWTLP